MGRWRNAARCPVALVGLGEAEVSRFRHLQAQHVSRCYNSMGHCPTWRTTGDSRSPVTSRHKEQQYRSWTERQREGGLRAGKLSVVVNLLIRLASKLASVSSFLGVNATALYPNKNDNILCQLQ